MEVDSETVPSTTTTLTVSTGITMEERSFIWEVENFRVALESDELLHAQRFKFQMGETIGLPTEWRLFLEADGNQPEESIGAFFHLVKKPEQVKEVNVSFLIEIYKLNGDKYFLGNVKFRNILQDPSCSWGYSRMFKRKAENLPLFNGSLVINVKIRLYSKKSMKLNVSGEQALFEGKAVNKLSHDLSLIPSFADAVKDLPTELVSVDDQHFPVNRGILAARSNVFMRMFQANMIETETGRVTLDDLSSKTVNVLIHYLYTGKLHDDWKTAAVLEELPYAAHKYELDLLSEFLDLVLGTVCKIFPCKQIAKISVMAKKIGMKRASVELLELIKKAATSVEDVVLME